MAAEGVWTEEVSVLTKAWYNSMVFPPAQWSYDHPEIIYGVGALLVLGGSALLVRKNRRAWLRKTRRLFGLKRGKQMIRKEYLRLVKTKINNAIVSGIEDAVLRGEFPASYANHTYKRLAFFFESKDFLPQKLPRDQRLTADEYEIIMKVLFNKTRAPIPGPKPGEVDNVYVYAKTEKIDTKRKFGDKVRRPA